MRSEVILETTSIYVFLRLYTFLPARNIFVFPRLLKAQSLWSLLTPCGFPKGSPVSPEPETSLTRPFVAVITFLSKTWAGSSQPLLPLPARSALNSDFHSALLHRSVTESGSSARKGFSPGRSGIFQYVKGFGVSSDWTGRSRFDLPFLERALPSRMV